MELTTSSTSQFERENGRDYHSFRAGLYMYPCDDVSFPIPRFPARSQQREGKSASEHTQPASQRREECDEHPPASPTAAGARLRRWLTREQTERDRLDMFHAMFKTARHGRLIMAPLNPTEHTRVLDLGTGTGIWAIEM